MLQLDGKVARLGPYATAADITIASGQYSVEPRGTFSVGLNSDELLNDRTVGT